jgi:hypothetical protein
MIMSATARAAGWTPPVKPRPTVSAKPVARKGAPAKSKRGAKVQRATTDLLLRRPTDLPDHQLAWGMPVGPKSVTRVRLHGAAAAANPADLRVGADGQEIARKTSKSDVNVACATVHADAIQAGKSHNLPAFLRK